MLGNKLVVNWEPGFVIWSHAMPHQDGYSLTCKHIIHNQDRPTHSSYNLFQPKIDNYSISFPAREFKAEYIVFLIQKKPLNLELPLLILSPYPFSPWLLNPNQGHGERMSPSCGQLRGRNTDWTDPHWSTGHTRSPSQRQLRGEINSQMCMISLGLDPNLGFLAATLQCRYHPSLQIFSPPDAINQQREDQGLFLWPSDNFNSMLYPWQQWCQVCQVNLLSSNRHHLPDNVIHLTTDLPRTWINIALACKE